ncbi:MAG: hypothetical protein HRT69_13560 [Flavobacteriaceae bacterium]|nr:hypothetical protein [Flavobacteriaceae bacterium]
MRVETTSCKYQLVEQSFTKYIDPYLIQESKYTSTSKFFEFIIILKENTSSNYLEDFFSNLEILKRFNHNTIVIVKGNKEIIE